MMPTAKGGFSPRPCIAYGFSAESASGSTAEKDGTNAIPRRVPIEAATPIPHHALAAAEATDRASIMVCGVHLESAAFAVSVMQIRPVPTCLCPHTVALVAYR